MQLRPDYQLDNPAGLAAFNARYMADMSFTFDNLPRNWKKFERTGNAEKIFFSRHLLLDIAGAAYSVQAHREFNQAVSAFSTYSLAKAAQFVPAPSDCYMDLCIALCLDDKDWVRMCTDRIQSASHSAQLPMDFVLPAYAEAVLAEVVAGSIGRAQNSLQRLKTACDSRSYPELDSTHFARWAACATALLERNETAFRQAMEDADFAWHTYLGKVLARQHADLPADESSARLFVDFGRAALLAIALTRLDLDLTTLNLRFVDVVWMRAGD